MAAISPLPPTLQEQSKDVLKQKRRWTNISLKRTKTPSWTYWFICSLKFWFFQLTLRGGAYELYYILPPGAPRGTLIYTPGCDDMKLCETGPQWIVGCGRHLPHTCKTQQMEIHVLCCWWHHTSIDGRLKKQTPLICFDHPPGQSQPSDVGQDVQGPAEDELRG